MQLILTRDTFITGKLTKVTFRCQLKIHKAKDAIYAIYY